MIKSLVYLDEHKLYSLSSQVFEGITEYIVSDQSEVTKDKESQKGPVGSGKVLADIIKLENRTSEKKFFHDYSYVLFEKHLNEAKKVISINEDNLGESLSSINKFSFIKISAPALFVDIEAISETLSNFNELGKLIASVGSNDEINSEIHNIKMQIEATKTRTDINRSQSDKIIKDLKENSSRDKVLERLVQSSNLHADQEYLNNLVSLLDFGFKKQFEVQQRINDVLFSAIMKRKYLREDVDELVKKYSRKSERSFVVFGNVAQSLSSPQQEVIDETESYSSIKEGLMKMALGLSGIENSFSGKLDKEVVIDPIAVYFEL